MLMLMQAESEINVLVFSAKNIDFLQCTFKCLRIQNEALYHILWSSQQPCEAVRLIDSDSPKVAQEPLWI